MTEQNSTTVRAAAKEHPILFSAPMVRALLNGRKTQTRRVIKPVPPIAYDRHCWFHMPVYGFSPEPSLSNLWHKVRLFAPGDRLWVREAIAVVGTVDPGWTLYRANGYEAECARHGFDKPYPPERDVRWRPSIHMPRSASRLTLAVTDVRVERLQDISAVDAFAEGIDPPLRAGIHVDIDGGLWPEGAREAVRAYGRLWDEINGPGSWDKNPWVVVYTFTTHHNLAEADKRSLDAFANMTQEPDLDCEAPPHNPAEGDGESRCGLDGRNPC